MHVRGYGCGSSRKCATAAQPAKPYLGLGMGERVRLGASAGRIGACLALQDSLPLARMEEVCQFLRGQDNEPNQVLHWRQQDSRNWGQPHNRRSRRKCANGKRMLVMCERRVRSQFAAARPGLRLRLDLNVEELAGLVDCRVGVSRTCSTQLPEEVCEHLVGPHVNAHPQSLHALPGRCPRAGPLRSGTPPLRLSNIGDCCSTGRVGNVKGSKVRPEQAS